MSQKLIIAMFIGIGALVGIIFTYGAAEAIHMTGDQKFCVSCHEMDPMVITYRDDVHGGQGKLGGSASCVDCHLPQDTLANYVYTKAKSGLVEVGIHFFGEPENINWTEKRSHRASFVFDTGCLKCHENVKSNPLSSKQAQKMHAHYEKLQGTDKEIKCAQCHFDVGHKGMRNVLNYYKPEFELYRYKMEDLKLETQEKYKKYGVIKHERQLEEKHVEHKPTG